jgi:lysophospholipase L1-like esterase
VRPAGRRVRHALGTVALVVAGTVVGLVLAEGVARVRWEPPRAAAPARLPAGLHELHFDWELAEPGAHGVYNGAVYRANRFGFRGRDYTVEKPAEVVRIVIAGDSVTMGSGVAEEDAYPARVERALNERDPPRRYEVLNLGLIGIDIHQVMDRLEELGLRFAPDVVVYGCTLNDIKGPAYRKSMELWPQLLQTQDHSRFATSPSYLLRVGWPLWVSARELIAARPGSLLFEQRDNYFANPPAWDRFCAGLDRLAADVRTRDIPGVVFVHTSLEFLNLFHPYGAIYARIADAARARGLVVIESFPALRGHDAVSLWVGPGDAHPNAAAHALLARALTDGLLAMKPGSTAGARPSDHAR